MHIIKNVQGAERLRMRRDMEKGRSRFLISYAQTAGRESRGEDKADGCGVNALARQQFPSWFCC
jgi:hypothetical protein